MLEIAKNDQRKVFFENCLDPRILQELQNESQAWRERITVDFSIKSSQYFLETPKKFWRLS